MEFSKRYNIDGRMVCIDLKKAFNNNNNNNNNIHLHSAFLLVIQSSLQSVLIVINLMKYYNDLIVTNNINK